MTLVLLLAPWQTALADDFFVNDPGDAPDINPGDGVCETAPDNDVCTLRAAIMEANARLATHPHSIVVPAYTIALVNGSLDITAPITVTITGAGVGATIIDGGGASRVFNITLPAATVTISGVTIQNGSTLGNGGGILNSGTLVVSGSLIQNNSAVWFGGGVFSDSGGNVTIQGGTVITGNSATAAFGGGGGISAGGALLITGGSTVGPGNTGVFGGGVNAFGTTTITGDASITGNGGGLGGGVYNVGASFTIQGATMTLNTSTGGGGAIYNHEGMRTVLITGAGTTIGPGNSGSDGGAAYNDGLGSTVIVQDGAVITGNTVTYWGGGLYNRRGGILNVTSGAQVTGNTAQRGGAISNESGGQLTIDGVTITGNTGTEGAIYNNGFMGSPTTLNVTNTLITGNTVGRGGGVFNSGSALASIGAGTVITGNTATGSGGGVFNGAFPPYLGNGTPPQLSVSGGATIASNSAPLGGAIYNADGAIVTVTGSILQANSGTTDGGAYYSATAGNSDSITGSCIVQNSDTAVVSGGGATVTATGNWWGAANGPGGAGPGLGDTVSANVDFSGFLTAPILGCPVTVTLPSLSIDDVSLAEGDAGTTDFIFTVTLSAAVGFPVTVNYATADSTATAGVDYVAASGPLTFAPGVLTQTITVTVNGDTTPEPHETFFVNLSDPTNATIADAQGVGTILNDDAVLAINDVSVTEGDSGTTVDAIFTVSMPYPSANTVTVDYATADDTATAGVDYVATSGTLTFAPGVVSQPIAVTVNGDDTIELDETFFINLSSPANATIADAQGVGTILNDDMPDISIDDVSVTEGDTGTTVDAVFTVTLSEASIYTVTVDYATADGTATAGVDYVATSGTLIFAPSVLTQTIAVTVNGDDIVEVDETFFVNLSNPVNATIADAQGVGTILNDDVPDLSIDDVSVTEGDSGTTVDAVFTVTLSQPSFSTVTVDYATADDTATAGTDYVATSGTLTFIPGVLTQTITVTVNGDDIVEADETFFVNLSDPANATIADAQGVGTILNDDVAGYSAAPATLGLLEGTSDTYTLRLTSQPVAPVTLTLSVNLPAQCSVTPTVVLDATNWNTATDNVTVTILADDIVEVPHPDCVVSGAVTTADPVYAALTPADYTVTVTDDDTPGYFISPPTLALTEGASGPYSIRLTSQPVAPVTLTLSVNLPAQCSVTPTVVLDATNWNTATDNVTVTILADDIAELPHPDCVVAHAVTTTDPVYAALAAPSDYTVTVTDDDVPGYSFSPPTLALTEGASGIYTVRLTSQPVAPVTLTLSVNLPAQCSVTPTVVLDATNWNTATDNVTVSILADDIAELPHPDCVIAHAVTTADPVYAALTPPDYTVTITDDDVPGYSFAPPTLALTEGASGIYTVRLTSQPVAPVTLTLSVNLPAQCSVTPTVVLDATNWNTATDNVTVTILDDGIAEVPHPDCVVTHAVTTADPVYAALVPPPYIVTVTDNDVPAVVVTPTSLELPDVAATATYDVSLATTPSAGAVTVVATFDPALLTVNGGSLPVTLIFTDTTPQTLTVAALPGAFAGGYLTTLITHAVTASDAPEYAGLPVASVTVGIGTPPEPPDEVAAEYPPPPPAPRCIDENFVPDSIIRASIPDSYSYGVFCRSLVENGQYLNWFGGPLTHSGQIGSGNVLDLNVFQAVDVFSPTGLTHFEGGAVVCLRGTGRMLWLSASQAPRVPQDIEAFQVAEFGGFSCVILHEPGTLVLARPNGVAGAPAPAVAVPLSGCTVTTRYMMNLREGPGTDTRSIRLVAYQATLTAFQRVGNWFEVDYYGTRGWLSGDYLTPHGACGQ